MSKPAIGISSCLLGICVRYDGGCKPSSDLVRTLGKSCVLIPVCPEHECGMPVPREPMDLYCTRGGTRLITVHTRRDMTDILTKWIRGFLESVEEKGFRGFVLKSGSPSCGIETANIHREAGLLKNGTGLFAGALMEFFPGIPVVQESELLVPDDISSFIEKTGGLRAES